MNELMEGVKVLSENVITYDYFGLTMVFGLIAILSIASTVITFMYGDDKIICSITIPLSILFIFLFVLAIRTPSDIYTQYKVTISDTVNFKEFTQKYEVINVDGEIYTVVEKKVEGE